MFTVEQRDALRERVLRLAEEDDRVAAGAMVGSLALGSGDRFSDLDLTFAVADRTTVADVLGDWTRALVDEDDAVQLVDLEHRPTTYRVFLLPDALQLDLSMTPAARFRPGGPRFRLLFGETAPGEPESLARPGNLFIPTQVVAHDIFGWGAVYALHGRSSIGRGRVWQARHYVEAVRDHALSLACLREGGVTVQARGYDDLSAETLRAVRGGPRRLGRAGRAASGPDRIRPGARPRGRGGGSRSCGRRGSAAGRAPMTSRP